MIKKQPITIIDQNRSIELTINRMDIFHVFTVIEATNADKQCFYLFFYKDKFLTGQKASHLARHSQLELMFKNSITFSSPHPLIDVLLAKNPSIVFQSFNQLLKKVRQQYSPQEVSLIFSLFDSFIPKENIINLMTSFFYNYRRNGQLSLAYQIIRLLKEFAPENKLANEICNHIEYLKYAKFYYIDQAVLLEKDALYGEMLYFRHRAVEAPFSHLQTHLVKEGRWINTIALYLDNCIHTKTFDSETCSQLLSSLPFCLSKEEFAVLLMDLYARCPSSQVLQETLFNTLMDLGQYTAAVQLLTETEQQPSLSPPQLSRLITALEDSSLDFDELPLKYMNMLLIQETNHVKVDKLLQLCVPRLLNNYDLPYVNLWLKPFEQLASTLPTVQKIKKMVELKENPDQQLGLGELYYEFNQFEKAIDCFSWEAELRPTDPVPVKWLMRIYRKLDMLEEMQAYEYMHSHLQKGIHNKSS